MENLSVKTPGTLSINSNSNYSIRAHSTKANAIKKYPKLN